MGFYRVWRIKESKKYEHRKNCNLSEATINSTTMTPRTKTITRNQFTLEKLETVISYLSKALVTVKLSFAGNGMGSNKKKIIRTQYLYYINKYNVFHV